MKTKKLATEFAVQSNSFETYEKFKEDVEKFGWIYSGIFFHPNNFFGLFDCLFFENKYFGISGSVGLDLVFNIDNQLKINSLYDIN